MCIRDRYYTFTTEESEKMELFALADKLGGNLELAIKRLAESKRNPQSSTCLLYTSRCV